MFALEEAEATHARWVMEGVRFGGYTVGTFDAVKNVLEVHSGSESVMLPLEPGRIASLDRGMSQDVEDAFTQAYHVAQSNSEIAKLLWRYNYSSIEYEAALKNLALLNKQLESAREDSKLKEAIEISKRDIAGYESAMKWLESYIPAQVLKLRSASGARPNQSLEPTATAGTSAADAPAAPASAVAHHKTLGLLYKVYLTFANKDDVV